MADIDAQIVIALDAGRPPHFAQQVTLRHHLAGVGEQYAEQAVFDRRQMHRLASAGDDAARQIDPRFAEFDDRARLVAAAALPAQQRTRTGAQFADAKGFGQVVVGPDVERLDLVLLVRACREDEDRHVRPSAQVADEVDAVAVGQAEIEHDQIGLVGAGFEQPVGTGSGLVHAAAFFLK